MCARSGFTGYKKVRWSSSLYKGRRHKFNNYSRYDYKTADKLSLAVCVKEGTSLNVADKIAKYW